MLLRTIEFWLLCRADRAGTLRILECCYFLQICLHAPAAKPIRQTSELSDIFQNPVGREKKTWELRGLVAEWRMLDFSTDFGARGESLGSRCGRPFHQR